MKKALKSVPSRSHEQATVESFRKDPEFAAEYLKLCLGRRRSRGTNARVTPNVQGFWRRTKTCGKGEFERQYPVPHAVPQRKSGTQEFKGCSASYGNAAHGPSIAKARRIKARVRTFPADPVARQ